MIFFLCQKFSYDFFLILFFLWFFSYPIFFLWPCVKKTQVFQEKLDSIGVQIMFEQFNWPQKMRKTIIFFIFWFINNFQNMYFWVQFMREINTYMGPKIAWCDTYSATAFKWRNKWVSKLLLLLWGGFSTISIKSSGKDFIHGRQPSRKKQEWDAEKNHDFIHFWEPRWSFNLN